MNKGWLAAGVVGMSLGALAASCSSKSSSGSPGGDAGADVSTDASTESPGVASGIMSLGAGQWNAALTSCVAAESDAGGDCDARYCELIARTMLVVNEINTFLLPRYRKPLTVAADAAAGDEQNLLMTENLLTQATTAAETVATMQCTFNLPSLPLVLGDSEDPVLSGEVRGLWTTRDAHMLAALFDSISYGLQADFSPTPVALGPDGGDPPLPPLLASMQQHLLAQDQLLFSQSVDASDASPAVGGWYDRNGNGIPDTADELLIDIFKPGTNDRVIDFSTAAFVKGNQMPLGSLTPTASLPPPICGYQQFHIDDVVSGPNLVATDGMSFSPDGTQVVLPLYTTGKQQIYSMDLNGANQTCLTCTQPGNNDGVRWRRGATPDAMLFISDRDHPYATGNAGGGFGQELYVMRTDGSSPTRLTTSDAWATNYHEEWSPDGTKVIWDSTESYAWDVMVADFVEDSTGMHLANTRVLVHDTTWWETHGFTADNQYVLTTNSQAGFQSTDLYAINIATGVRTRLTSNTAWDEHGHISPDGREISWMTARWHPASIYPLNTGAISPTFDFLWVIPGVFFEFLNPPAGYSTELTLMDADGTNIRQLTKDGLVVADNQWSEDGKHIIFRQSDTGTFANATTIRILTFDDCQGSDGGATTAGEAGSDASGGVTSGDAGGGATPDASDAGISDAGAAD